MFWDNFSEWGRQPALCTRKTSVSYEHLAVLCDKFSAFLPQTKSLVLIETDNSIESIVALFGTLRAGHVAMLYDPNNEILKKNIRDAYSPDYIYSMHSNIWKLESNSTDRDYELHKDLALVISTSGSTGSTKCVRLSRNNISSNTASISKYLNLSQTENTALILPIHYCYGLSVLNTHLSVGAIIHVGNLSVVQPNFIKYLKDNRITSFAGVPYTFELLDRINFQDERLPDLRYISQAGGKLSPPLMRKYIKWAKTHQKKMFVMYGQSEATARMAYMPPDILEKFPDCIGIAIPGGTLSLHDKNGNNVEQIDTPGELVYQGQNVMMGYAAKAFDLTKDNEVTQLKTGDIACRNKHDYYYITGRIKRFSKIFGKRYNLDEIERFIHGIDHTAVCVSDDKMLFIGSENKAANVVVDSVSQRFGIPIFNIKSLYFSSKPTLPSGKIDYQGILEIFNSQQLNPETTKKGRSGKKIAVIDLLTNIYSNAFPGNAIKEEDSFSSLGGDSLTYVSVSMDIETILGKLPQKWEEINIGELSKTNQNLTSTSFSSTETGVLIRVYAILAIVTAHTGAHAIIGGATLLILLAGVNYSRFHLNKLLIGQFSYLTTSILKNLLIPYWMILIASNLYHQSSYIGLSDFLLVGNFFPKFGLNAPFYTWFVQALIHSIVLVSTPLLIPSIRVWANRNKLLYFVYMLSFASLLRVMDGYFGIGLDAGEKDQRTLWAFWIFCYGAIISLIKTPKEKIICTALIVALAFMFFSEDYSRIVTLSVGTTILIWLKTIKVFKPIVPVIKTIGSASMFIYMLHLTGIVHFTPSPHDFDSTVFRIVVGVFQGIVAWKVYTYIEKKFLISIPKRRNTKKENI